MRLLCREIRDVCTLHGSIAEYTHVSSSSSSSSLIDFSVQFALPYEPSTCRVLRSSVTSARNRLAHSFLKSNRSRVMYAVSPDTVWRPIFFDLAPDWKTHAIGGLLVRLDRPVADTVVPADSTDYI